MPHDAKKFADFYQEGVPLDGDKVTIDSALNQEILVTGFRIKSSRFSDKGSGKCLTIQFEIQGVRKVVFTGSQVLIEQFEKYGEEIPFLTTIKKIDRYYTLS